MIDLLLATGNRDKIREIRALLSGLSFRIVTLDDVPGLPDVVENGKNGFVVPPRDSAALATAAAEILGDDALRERMGLATRELAETRFGWESIAEKTLEMYGKGGGDQPE